MGASVGGVVKLVGPDGVVDRFWRGLVGGEGGSRGMYRHDAWLGGCSSRGSRMRLVRGLELRLVDSCTAGCSYQLGRGRLQRLVTVKDLSSPATAYRACRSHICSLQKLAQGGFPGVNITRHTFRPANMCKTDPGVARSAFNDRSARLHQSLFFSLLDEVECGAVLHGATGVHKLGFAVDVAAGLVAESVEPY